MQWSKLDASLHAALADQSGDETLSVFVDSVQGKGPSWQDEAFKTKRVGRELYVASVLAGDVDELSERPWVRKISLAAKAHPTSDSKDPSPGVRVGGPSMRMRGPTGKDSPRPRPL